MNSTIEFFDGHTGEAKTYRRYSARLPEFNKKFGPGTGYRVKSSICSVTDLQPARMEAIREAVVHGRKPEEFGLGKLSALMVCTHRLLDSEGRVVCDARAAALVHEFKDLEVLETASHQRLLARVGFGGDIFDDDEDREIAAVASARGAARQTASADRQPAPQPAERSRAARPRRKPAEKPRQAKAAAAPEKAAETPAAGGQTKPDPGPGRSPDTRAVPPATLRQLAQLAARAGEQLPEVSSFAEAKAELRRLSGLVNGAAAS